MWPVLVAAPLVLVLVLAVGAFAIVLYNYHKGEVVKRHNALYRFNPDINGNYPVYFNLEENYYRPDPGNAGNPGTYQVTVQPPNKHYYHDQPILINPPKKLVEQPPLTQLPDAPGRVIEGISGEISEISPDIRQILTNAKRMGEGKIAALKSVGLLPGKGKDYTFWSKEWEAL